MHIATSLAIVIVFGEVVNTQGGQLSLSEELYVVGDSSWAGWSPPDAVQLRRTNSTSYIFEAHLYIKNTGYGFKFIRSRDGWQDDVGMLKGTWEVYPRLGYGAQGALEQTTEVNIPPAAVAGWYDLTVDLSAGTWRYECSSACGFIDEFFPASNVTRELTILYTGKIRGALLPQRKDSGATCTEAEATSDDCIGGLPYIAAYAQKLRDEGREVLLLDAGEYVLGGDFYANDRGIAAAKLARLAQYTALGASARDLVMGSAAMTNFTSALGDIPFILSNAQLPSELLGSRSNGKPFISPWARVELPGGVVGLLSMVSTKAEAEIPGLLVNHIRNDVIATMQHQMTDLFGPGGSTMKTVIVMMSHNFDSEVNVLTAQEWNQGTLAAHVPYIDVIIGGVGSLGTVTITEFQAPLLAFGWEETYGGVYAHRVDVTLNDQGTVIDYRSSSVRMDSSSAPINASNEVLREAYRLHAKASTDAAGAVLLGRVAENIFHEGDPSVLLYDAERTPMLTLVTKALYQQCGDCDVVMVPPSIIDTGLVTGEVRMADVIRTVIVADEEADFVVLEMAGAWLLEGLKELFEALKTRVSIYGARLTVNTMSAFGKLGGVYIKDGPTFQPIQRNRKYRVGVPRYMLVRKQPMVFWNMSISDSKGDFASLLAAYIQNLGIVTAVGPVREVFDVRTFRESLGSKCRQSDTLSEEDIWRNECFITYGNFPEQPELLGICSGGEIIDPLTLLCTKCPAGTYMVQKSAAGRRFFAEPFVESVGGLIGTNLLAEFLAMEAPQQCVPCQPGQRSGEGQVVCSLCAVGRFSNASNGGVCIDCAANSVTQELGSTTCLAAVGFYKDRAGGIRTCPVRRTTLEVGATSLLDCVCTKGTRLVDGACQECGPFQTTAGHGAGTCTNEITFYIAFLFVPMFAAFLLLGLGCSNIVYRKLLKQIEVQRLREEVKDCIRGSNSLAFPFVVMSAETFQGLGKLVPYEDAHNRHLLWAFPTLETVHKFLDAKQKRIVFFSHQWLAWAEPDPNHVHYKAIVTAIDAVVAQMEWSLCDCYLWVDYHSVPQFSKQLQFLAVKTLPIFASLASLFVIIAPEAVQADTGLTCNLSTYNRRMWCRAEVFAFFCQRGTNNMYLAEESGDRVVLAPVVEEAIAHTIQVFEGECTCCARNHTGMTSCDKELLRDTFIAIYAQVFWNWSSKRSIRTSIKAETVAGIIQNIQSRREQVFPKTFEAFFIQETNTTTIGSASQTLMKPWGSELGRQNSSSKLVKRQLFGSLIETLEEMISENSEEIIDLLNQRYADNDSNCLNVYPEPAAERLDFGPCRHVIVN